MKVNFEFLKTKKLSGDIQIINIRESLAELIYERFAGLKYKLLAEKIYKETPCELTDIEIDLLKSIANHDNGILSAKIVDAINDALIEKRDE